MATRAVLEEEEEEEVRLWRLVEEYGEVRNGKRKKKRARSLGVEKTGRRNAIKKEINYEEARKEMATRKKK